jgi:hypothetical protein
MKDIVNLRKYLKRINIFHLVMAAVFVAGFAARMYLLLKYRNSITINSDDQNYVNSAVKLLETGQLTYAGDESPSVFIMPAYPVFLSTMIWLFGMRYGLIAARFAQIIISMAGCWILYHIAVRFFVNRWVALITSAIVMFYPAGIIMPNLLLTETWFTTLTILCVYLCLLFLEKPSMKLAIWLGITFTGAIYFRPVIALFPVIVCLIMFFKKYGISFLEKFKYAFVWALVMAALLSPWWIRNYVHYRTFIPATASSGNPLLYGSYVNYEGIVNGNRLDWPIGKNRFETDKLQREMAINRIKDGFREDFKSYFHWYTVEKFKRLWRYPFSWYMPPEINPWLLYHYHNCILLLGFLGVVASLFIRRRLLYSMAVLLFIAYSSLINMVYVAAPRYCYPQIPLLVVLGGAFLQFAVLLIRKMVNGERVF